MSRIRVSEPVEEKEPEVEKFVECLKGHNMYLSEGKCKKCGSPPKPVLEEAE